MEQGLIRIEHPEDGQGVFNSTYGFSIFDAIAQNDFSKALDGYALPNKLNLVEDCPGCTDDHYCAYKDVEQFKGFYPNGFKAIVDRGFKIYSISVDNAIIGQQQVAFRKDDILSKIDITNEFIT